MKISNGLYNFPGPTWYDCQGEIRGGKLNTQNKIVFIRRGGDN